MNAQAIEVTGGEALRNALAAAKDGARVFPLLPRSKKPAITGWPTRASLDPDTIEGWARKFPGCNWAIATGERMVDGVPRHVAVVDLDTKGGVNGVAELQALAAAHDGLPETTTVNTPSGGRHLYLYTSRPVGVNANDLAPGVDVRGVGGYVVCPGSEIDGKAYTLAKECEPAECPEWLEALLPHPGTKPGERGSRERLPGIDPARAHARAVEYLTKHAPEAVEGAGGDHTTFKVAAKLKDLGVEEATAVELMLEHWHDGCGWSPDELAVKVANAFRYGANPPGADAPEAQFEPVPEAEAEPAKPTRENPFKPLRLADLRKLPRPEWTIADLIPATGMGIIYGPSGSGKTFLTLDIGGACVRGVPWAGLEVKQGVVVYVGLEGQARVRVEAYAKTHGLADADLADLVIFEQPPLNLLDVGERAASTQQLIAAVKGATGRDICLTIVDTLAQATPGGDENSSVMMSAVIANAKQIRHALGGTVLLVHHTGKDQNAGARGHSSLMAASDFALSVTRSESGSTRQVKVSKVKDAEDGAQWTFRLDRVTLETEPKLITSCVVAGLELGQLVTAAPAKGRNLTPLQTNVLRALQHAITADDAGGAIDWDGTRTASIRAWRASYYLRTPVDPEEKDNRRKSFDKAVQLLTAGSAVEIVTTGGSTAYRPVAAF